MTRPAVHNALLAIMAAFCALGCRQGPFQPPAGQASATNSAFQQQAQTLTTQVQDLNRRVGQLDLNNADLHRQLAQADQQKQMYQEQVSLLQKQLGDMATKLKDTQVARQESDKRVSALQASTQFRGGAAISANNSIAQSLSTISIPGIDIRQDGGLIRIELPGDKLFAPGTAQMLTDGYRLVDEVAASIIRSYPRQRIVIEGHTDDSTTGNPAAAHLLTSAQTQAVFTQLVQRGRLPARQLSILAMGENHPQASNATPAGKAKNRRVEIVVYPDPIDG
jgi:flagellar motor protein MotB